MVPRNTRMVFPWTLPVVLSSALAAMVQPAPSGLPGRPHLPGRRPMVSRAPPTSRPQTQSLPLKRGMLRYAFTRKLPVQVRARPACRRCLARCPLAAPAWLPCRMLGGLQQQRPRSVASWFCSLLAPCALSWHGMRHLGDTAGQLNRGIQRAAVLVGKRVSTCPWKAPPSPPHPWARLGHARGGRPLGIAPHIHPRLPNGTPTPPPR